MAPPPGPSLWLPTRCPWPCLRYSINLKVPRAPQCNSHTWYFGVHGATCASTVVRTTQTGRTATAVRQYRQTTHLRLRVAFSSRHAFQFHVHAASCSTGPALHQSGGACVERRRNGIIAPTLHFRSPLNTSKCSGRPSLLKPGKCGKTNARSKTTLVTKTTMRGLY